jgi:hypothetical protein
VATSAPTTTAVASATYGGGDTVYSVGHPQPGLDQVIPPGRYHAEQTSENSMIQRCSSPMCGGGQVGSQIDATTGVAGGSVIEILPSDSAVWLFNMTLTGPLG